jgi:glycosyltransferase involved in cell wall biosynthesis
MKNIIVSVIIPVFNQEKYLGRCLRSLLSQSLGLDSFQIITIDDGSTDHTKEILDTFSSNIKIFSNKKNLGLPASLNIGIKNAKSKYIVRVDSDDYVNFDYFNGPNSELKALNEFILEKNLKYKWIGMKT